MASSVAHDLIVKTMRLLSMARLSHAVRSMDLLDRLFDIARRRNRKIVLPESDDVRVVAAATRLRDQHLARPTLLGAPSTLKKIVIYFFKQKTAYEIIDPRSDKRLK